jgi:hypothetical protein
MYGRNRSGGVGRVVALADPYMFAIACSGAAAESCLKLPGVFVAPGKLTPDELSHRSVMLAWRAVALLQVDLFGYEVQRSPLHFFVDAADVLAQDSDHEQLS